MPRPPVATIVAALSRRRSRDLRLRGGMRGLALLGAAAGLLAAATAGYATQLQQCCACLAQPVALVSGRPADAVIALFCAETDDVTQGDLEARCEDVAPMGALACEANIPGPSCRDQLLASGIACPAASAPTAGVIGLSALAVALAVGGVLRSRRRALLPTEGGAAPLRR